VLNNNRESGHNALAPTKKHMIKYYFNPKDQSLTIFNPETDELMVMEPLKVRVVIAEDARRGINQGEDDFGRAQKAKNGTPKKSKKPRLCKKCGEAGHRSDSPLCRLNMVA